MRGAVKYLAVFVAALLVPTFAYAQATLTGTVRDSSGSVLPGVTVEATSPALTEKTRTVVTDGNGVYRIIELNPGIYSLSFTLPGFNVVRRTEIQLQGTVVITIPIELRVGALQETVTVTGETPVVDVQSVRREVVLDSEIIQTVPGTRTVGNLLNATPGLTVDGNGAEPDADDDVLQRARRPDQRRPHDGERPDRRRGIQWRRRVVVHPRHRERRRNDGDRVGRHGRIGYRRSSDEHRPARGRQHASAGRRSTATPATGRGATTSTTSSARWVSPRRRASSRRTIQASRTVVRSSGTGCGSSAAIAN